MKLISASDKETGVLKERPTSNGTRERCREYLPPENGKPERGCLNFVPQGKSFEATAARLMHLCKYCYRARFPKRGPSNLPACRKGSQRLLTPWEKEEIEKRSFGWMDKPDGQEAKEKHSFEWLDETNWTPELFEEWMKYWEDKLTNVFRYHSRRVHRKFPLTKPK